MATMLAMLQWLVRSQANSVVSAGNFEHLIGTAVVAEP